MDVLMIFAVIGVWEVAKFGAGLLFKLNEPT